MKQIIKLIYRIKALPSKFNKISRLIFLTERHLKEYV